MTSYVLLFVGVVFGILGFVAGGWIALCVADNCSKKVQTPKKRIRDKKDRQDIYDILAEPEVEEETKEESGLLKRRLGGPKESWMDFNCTCDGTLEEECIKKAQQKEDASYRYIQKR